MLERTAPFFFFALRFILLFCFFRLFFFCLDLDMNKNLRLEETNFFFSVLAMLKFVVGLGGLISALGLY